MSVGRDTIRDGLLASIGVVVFIAFLIAAGTMSPNGLGEMGVYTIIGGIVAFIVTMAFIGIFFLGD